MQNRQVWILDFGSQYTQLITRKVRELGFSSCILTVEQGRDKLSKSKPEALILSGGPQSIFEDNNDYDFIFSAGVPVLGICYGMQLMAKHFKGTVERGKQAEYGSAKVYQQNKNLVAGLASEINVWMSHFDHVSKAPAEFEIILHSDNGMVAGIKHRTLPLVGLQFHPEVSHTEGGDQILSYFFNEVAGLKKDWEASCMLEEAKELVSSVGDSKILCAFSGGVDSLVAATVASKMVGDNLYCFFVDNGLLRPQDYTHIEELKKETDLNIEVIDAKEEFITKLEGISDPEEKRKIIGHTFIEVFEQKVHQFEVDHNIKFEYLLQGTLYPDVIESISPHKQGGKSVTIKSHHNVGGLPDKMRLSLLEPLAFLFKDECRQIGDLLGLKDTWVKRHPFPGPGIGIRVMGKLSSRAIEQVGQSDQILLEELQQAGIYHNLAQAFTVLLPVQTVGIKGDARAYEEVICLRLVSTSDFMTADWSDVPRTFLDRVSRRITNEVAGITRVVYDITSKPPATIEWE